MEIQRRNVHFDQATHTFQTSEGKAAKEPPSIEKREMPKTPLYDPNAEITFKATQEKPQPKVAAAIKVPLIGASIIPPNA